MTNRLAPEFLRRWHATDVAWPAPADALQACRENASTLRHHGVNVRSGVDAFNILEAVASLGIRDPNSIGLVLWSGPHPRRHDGRFSLLQEELKHLRWTHKDFLSASFDALSSARQQATVIACDDGNWANNIIFGLDLKPLATFRTQFGQAGSSVFRSEASGFEGRHIRQIDTDQFLGCGLVGLVLLRIVGSRAVDIPSLAIEVAHAGLHVVFVGEYTCALSRHCLSRALAGPPPIYRMLCDRP